MSLDFYLEVPSGAGDDFSEVFSANITHNLGKMAGRCGLYNVLWHPEWERFEKAGEIVERLMDGLALLKANEAFFRRFDSPNGWGKYEHFISFVEEVAKACHENRGATIRVSI